jgi:hypothetical protein
MLRLRLRQLEVEGGWERGQELQEERREKKKVKGEKEGGAGIPAEKIDRTSDSRIREALGPLGPFLLV